MLTAGENLSPITIPEKIISFILILFGSIFMAIIFGEVAVAISNFYARQSRYQTKMEYLFESMKRMDLPSEIQSRVYSYYDYIHRAHGTLNGETTMFIPELSKKLAAEVLMYLRMDMIHKVPFFQNISPEVVQQLVLKLTLQVFLPKEYICVRGEVGDEMFFISDGFCEVTIPFKDMPTEKKDEIVKEHLKKALTTQRKKSTTGGVLGTFHGRRKSDMGGERSVVEKTGNNTANSNDDSENSAASSSTNNSASQRGSSSNANDAPKNSYNSTLNDKKDAGDETRGAASTHGERKGSNFMSMLTRKKDDTGADNLMHIPDDKEMVLATLQKGSHFGEIALILLTKRTANVRAKGFCELCTLNRDVYNGVVAVYIEDKKAMEDYIMTKYGNKDNVQQETNKMLHAEDGDVLEENGDEWSDSDEEDKNPKAGKSPKSPSRRKQALQAKQNSFVVKEIKTQATNLNAYLDEGVRKMNSRLEDMATLQKGNKDRMEAMQKIIEDVRIMKEEKEFKKNAKRKARKEANKNNASSSGGGGGDGDDGDGAASSNQSPLPGSIEDNSS
jgi:CRP-like cAMP-binding protein